jgi:hypothetical protein
MNVSFRGIFNIVGNAADSVSALNVVTPDAAVSPRSGAFDSTGWTAD